MIIPPWSLMSVRKSFILTLNCLLHSRRGVQNPDNKINSWRLKKRIWVWCFPSLQRWHSLQLAWQGKHSARRRQLGQLEAVLAALGPVLQTGVSSLPTDQAINKTLVNQQEYALFFKMKEISYSIYIWKLVSLDYIGLVHVLNIVASSLRRYPLPELEQWPPN